MIKLENAMFREKHSVGVTAYPITRGGEYNGDIRLGLNFHAKRRPAHLDPTLEPLFQARRLVLSPVPSLDPVAENAKDSPTNGGSSLRSRFGGTADDAPSPQSSRHPSYDFDGQGRRDSLPLDSHPPPAHQLRHAQSTPTPTHAQQQQPPLAPPPFQDDRMPLVRHVEEYNPPVWPPGRGGRPSRDGSSYEGSSHGGSGYGGPDHGNSGRGGHLAPALEYVCRPNNGPSTAMPSPSQQPRPVYNARVGVEPPPSWQIGPVYNAPVAVGPPPSWHPGPVHNVPGGVVCPGPAHNVPVVAPAAALHLKTPNRVEPTEATREVHPGDFSFADVPQLAYVPYHATLSMLSEMPRIRSPDVLEYANMLLHPIFLFIAIYGVLISTMIIRHHQIAPSSVDGRIQAISICGELIISIMPGCVVMFLVGPGSRMSTWFWSKCILKYHFWLLVGSILPKAVALYLADLVRRMIPQLAPCNALQDDVTCSATTSAFISHTTCVVLSSLAKRERIVDTSNRYKRRTHFSNQNFKIGGGLVSVMKLSENQYRFTSSARGTFLEDFVAPTNWERMSIILSILELWEASPKVGVVENLILWRGGIYCHALNVKEIVEGVLKSPYQFSIFHLVEKRRFFVGCGDRGVDERIPWLIFIASIGAALSGYYQLKDTYPKVAIGIFVTSIVLAFIILIVSSSSRLFTQSCFYWLCTLLCWMNANWRLGVYILLKKLGCTSLPYCDEFQPDKLLREDRNVEVNSLLMTPYKYKEGSIAVECSPDWTMFPTISIENLDTHDEKGAPWINITPNVNNTNNNMRFKLFKALRKPDVNYDAIIFKMEFTYSNFLLKSSRVIEVTSVYDETKRQDKMIGHISSDGRTRPYKWSVSSFHLFVYLVLMWGRLNYGVIEKDENFMFRTYYHVFNIQGLAKHIVDNNLETYFVSLADQTPQSPSAISKLVRIAKEVVNVVISCCNRLQVPCKTALGQESLSSV